MYNYPYGNTSQLNMDWILQSWRQFQRQIEDMIAPQYSESSTYPANSLVIYQHVLYYNPAAITGAGPFDPESWEQIDIATIVTGGI